MKTEKEILLKISEIEERMKRVHPSCIDQNLKNRIIALEWVLEKREII